MRTRPALAAALLAAASADACLWNIDTTAFEQVGGTDLDNVLFGRFPHHGDELWEWRVRDRRRRLEETPGDLELVDDLAVALEKTGRVGEAIELIRPVVEDHPERYTALANLGTFLIHAGDLEAGAAMIERALEVNPEAHFGRERYQLLLVRYVLAQRAAGVEGLPLRSEDRDFADFLDANLPVARPRKSGRPRSANSERRLAIEGLKGMLQFGNFDSPVLHEAIGDLLSADSQPLYAAIAYRQAARFAEDPAAADEYRRLSDQHVAALPEDARGHFDSDFTDHLNAAAGFREELAFRERTAVAAADAGDATADPDAVAPAFFEDRREFPKSQVREVTLNPNDSIGNAITAAWLLAVGVIAAAAVTVVLVTRKLLSAFKA